MTDQDHEMNWDGFNTPSLSTCMMGEDGEDEICWYHLRTSEARGQDQSRLRSEVSLFCTATILSRCSTNGFHVKSFQSLHNSGTCLEDGEKCRSW